MRMPHSTLLLLLSLCLTLAAGIQSDEPVRLSCTADTNLSSYETEHTLNYGKATRIRLKGIQMLGLFRFDVEPIKGRVVRSARLYLRYAGTERMLRTLGFSTVTSPWEEGDGQGERKLGEACFDQAKLGARNWAEEAVDFAEAIFTPPGAWGYADIRDEDNGWISCSVPSAVVQAMVSGLATGIAVTDEKGQTAANNDVFSREQSGSGPYLVVSTTEGPAAAPASVEGVSVAPSAAGSEPTAGAIRVAFTASAEAFGVRCTIARDDAPAAPLRQFVISMNRAGTQTHVLRHLDPARRVRVTLTTVGPTGLSGRPVTVLGMTSPKLVLPAPMASSTHLQSLKPVPVFQCGTLRAVASNWDARYDPLAPAGQASAARLWNGKEVVLNAAIGERCGITLAISNDDAARHQVSLSCSLPMRLRPYRLLYCSDSGFRPDACLPLDGPVSLPDANIPGQKSQQFLLEAVSSPIDKPAVYRGVVRISVDGVQKAAIPVAIRLHPVVLPARPRFELSLNAYGSPARAADLDPSTPAGIRMEHAFHVLAHEHRGTLTPLGYSHSGNVEPGYAPPTSGSGRQRHVTDWSSWDARFGGLLDGKLFRQTPRGAQPVTHLYLPFHEAWPEDIRQHYAYIPKTRDYPAVIVEHALFAGPIEQMVASDYAAGIEAVVRDFGAHIAQMGWRQTSYQFFLNNKYYYRDPATGGRGTSWWLLDEPMHRDDWLALAWFARRMRNGVRGLKGHGMVFRADLSRPQWEHGYLDGLLDLMVVNDELYHRPALMRHYREDLGVRLWHYGSPGPVRDPLQNLEAWPIRAYLAGADGIVPWQTIGRKSDYTRPEETALILPSLHSDDGEPIATLRLKALSKGMEDVEYLRALAARRGWNRVQTAASIDSFLDRKDFAGMRAAILDTFAATGVQSRLRIHEMHRSGQALLGRPESPKPKP